jgi:hypothetical protein
MIALTFCVAGAILFVGRKEASEIVGEIMRRLS